MSLQLYLHHLEDLPIVRSNVADPFRAAGGRAILRDEVRESGVVLCDSVADADVCALPAHWHAYEGELRRVVLRFLHDSESTNRRVVVWVNGDDEVDFPFRNVIVFQHAFQKSRARRHEVRAYPPFFEDPVDRLFGGRVDARELGDSPVIGFCGQARPRLDDEAKRLVWKSWSRLRAASRRTDSIPEPWSSHVFLRRKVLRRLAADPRIVANFVLRDRYRAGAETLEERRDMHLASAVEFFQNIRGSDFTVCVRGGGNFSARLFETLSLGRLPLIVDTDSLSPWPDHPFWRNDAVAVDAHDLGQMVPAVLARYSGLDSESFTEMQYRAREFWLDRISLPGYFAHFREAIDLPRGC